MMKPSSIDSLKEFRKIPGVGKSLSHDFVDLGYKTITDLKGENPEVMYLKLADIRGHSVDKCVLYVFRCAVYLRWKLRGGMQKVDDAYRFDGLHLNEEGYRRWKKLLKPLLFEKYISE